MENTRTFTTAPGNITYSMVVKRNGVELHSQQKFTHFHHARWHKVVWSGSSAEPQVRVRHNMPYFMASKAVWNYDLSVQVKQTVLASQYEALNKKRTEQAALGPMANLLLTTNFGATGGRPEIGPLPQWSAMYLISQDERAREIMMAYADVAGAVPVHYRDEDTGNPVDLETRPQIALRFLMDKSIPRLPLVIDGKTIYSPDSSHQASFSYLPYLLTGDAYYQDEMVFWAGWNMAAVNPEDRGRGAGWLKDQVRGQAWSLRALGEAARSLPDGHSLKPYFQSRLAGNLKWFHDAYITNPDPSRSPMGATFDRYIGSRTGPWQGDFMAIVLAQLAENGEPLAGELLAWTSRFNIGRVTSDAQGFCAARAPGYFWYIRAPNNGPFFTTWAQMTAANYPADVGKSCATLSIVEGYPSGAGGYAAVIRTMLATSASVNVAEAQAAFDKWKGMTPNMYKDYANNPTWAIVPR
jgi:hypothetical protein